MQLPAFVQSAVDEFNKGRITLTELKRIGDEHDIKFAVWDMQYERNPNYPEGNNQTREGFTHHISSTKGHKFQYVVKPAILKIIDWIHKWAVSKWDKDAFVYDDPRLKYLDTHLHQFVEDNFNHDSERKKGFMHKVVDIFMWMTMKEDIYYSVRFMHMFNSMPFFVLTEREQQFLEIEWEKTGRVDCITLESIGNKPSSTPKLVA